MRFSFIIPPLAAGFFVSAIAAKDIEPPPDADTYAIRQVPAMTALVGKLPAKKPYFEAGYDDFKPLLDYLDDHDIDALAPVEGMPSAEPGMLFFPLPKADSGREFPAHERVVKMTFPARLFATHTFRGGYDQDTLDGAEKRLRAWLSSRPGYRVDGSSSYAYWSPYYYPPFLKKAEVRLPVVEVKPAVAPKPAPVLSTRGAEVPAGDTVREAVR